MLTDGAGIPLGCTAAPANLHDSPLLRTTLEQLSRVNLGCGAGPPEQITVHLDAGYDSMKTRELLAELGCDGGDQCQGGPVAGGRSLGRREDQLLAHQRF